MGRKVVNGLIILISVCVSLLFLEFLVRWLDLPPRPCKPAPIATYRLSENPVIGFEHIPGAKPTDKIYDISHMGYSINSFGFRDREYPVEKPDGTYRIILLGNSTTAGNGVKDFKMTYGKQLEGILNSNKQDPLNYEVINMGVGGYHTLQEVETFRTKGLQFDPDMVLVLFCINDFDLTADGNIYETLKRENKLVTSAPGNELAGILLKYSRLAFILYYRTSMEKTDYREWYKEKVLKGESPVKAGFKLLDELQHAHGFNAYVTILPAFDSPFDKYRDRWKVVHHRVFKAAEGLTGIRVFDLYDNFRKVNNNAPVFAWDGYHMNEYGHKVLASIFSSLVKFSLNEGKSKNK